VAPIAPPRRAISAGSAPLYTGAAVAISTPDPRRGRRKRPGYLPGAGGASARRVSLPRSLPGSRRPEPYSRADAPYFRSPGFFVRIAGLGALVALALGLLALRAWSVQVLHGRQYTAQASSQAWRSVDLIGPRGAIVDAHGRKLATMSCRVVVAADVAALGQIDRTGWHPTPTGLAALRRLSRISHTPVRTLVQRIEHSVIR